MQDPVTDFKMTSTHEELMEVLRPTLKQCCNYAFHFLNKMNVSQYPR
jgi:hypothetical protein